MNKANSVSSIFDYLMLRWKEEKKDGEVHLYIDRLGRVNWTQALDFH